MVNNKEKGYALLSVLLVITIFMVIVLTFMGRGFSSVKQNQVAEKNSQSVALAEMGIKYYQTAIQNIYTANIGAIGNAVKDQITLDRQSGVQKSTDYYTKLAISKLKDKIETELKTEKTSVSVDGRPSSTFTLTSTDYYRTTQDSKILLKVTGSENGKTTVLSTEMTFAPTINGLDSNGNTLPPTFDSIKQPTQNFCSNPSSIGSCQSILITISPKTFTDKLNNTNSVTLYSNGVLILNTPANANNMSNVKIHTDGDLTIDGNVQNTSSATIESKGNLIINGQLKLLAATNVFVKGNVTITKQLTLESGSKMCVVGTIDTSKIHYKGGVLIQQNKVSATDWTAKCGTPSNPDVVWGDEIYNNVNYEY